MSAASATPDKVSGMPDLDPRISYEHPDPVYVQLAGVIAADIAAGAFRATAPRLPSEPELAERYGVARGTVRKALRKLDKEEVVRVSRGRGTFILERRE